jgi:TRAP-type C4-dicarboxylate transport system permease small subunit
MNQAPTEPRWRWVDRAEQLGRRVENGAITLVFAGLTVLSVSQIVLRNVFATGIAWTDGLIRLTVLWLAVLGAVAASRDHKHLSIDLLARYAPRRLRRFGAILSNTAVAVVTALLARYSWAFVQDSRSYGDVLLDNWPAWPFQLILPVGFALMSYRYILRALQHLRGS